MANPNGAVDLGSVMKAAGLPTELPPDMARGLDLNIVRNKKKHQHRWSATGRYLVTDKQVGVVQAQLDKAQADAKERVAAGLEVIPVMIQVPLTQPQLMGVDGPGCIKCGLHMTAEAGLGKFCEKSDDEFPGLAGIYDQQTPIIDDAVVVAATDNEEGGDDGGEADILPFS